MAGLRVPILLGFVVMATVQAGDRVPGAPYATRSPVLARHGMVCTSQPLASQVGLEILKAGGSAVDAAIAVNAALGLMEPTGCGVGGDLFVLLWDAEERRLVGLDGSGRSPRGLDLAGLRERLAARGEPAIPRLGGLPVSVPGCVDGWFTLHARYGRLPMERLLAPAIAYAREGFPVTQVIADGWRRSQASFVDFPAFMATYMPGGRAPAEGDVFRNPDLARTYALIAAGGRDAFYAGELAADIEVAVREAGGALSRDDLADHRSQWVEPLAVSYRGFQVWELPPAGQGLAALQMLAILDGWSSASLRRDEPLAWHRLIEAKKLVYEDRARFYADPARADVPVAGLLSPEYAAERRALVDDGRAAAAPEAGAPPGAGDTVCFVVADDAGNVVSWIQSNYMGFGSGVVPAGRGFTLQNRGQLFHLDPGHRNVYAPGKRPFHTIIPAVMTRDGVPVLAFGVMGGAMQPQGHVQIVVNLVDGGLNVQEAGDAPRWRHEGSSEPTGGQMIDGGQVFVESGVPQGVVQGLRDRGHRVTVQADGYGGYQAIWIDDLLGEGRLYRGASESRKDGAAVGW